ncbi:MAG: hypothetical protein JNL70_24765 [Saprospiraceae bacterium]|nr:hypothetical protein [Saprospiraceae bacterium]
MAYKKVSTDNYEAAKLKIERLKRFNDPFAYTAAISLAAYEKTTNDYKVAIDAKNAGLVAIDELTIDLNAKAAAYEKAEADLRLFIGRDKGLESDEYVAAGGIRQSEIIAQQQKTREANKKASEDKDKTE